MTITIRLPDGLEAELRRRVDAEGTAVSEFVREAIAEKLARGGTPRPSPYELGKNVFGKYGSGGSEAGRNRKAKVRELVRAKHRRR